MPPLPLQACAGMTGAQAQQLAQARLDDRRISSEARCRVALQLPERRVVHNFAAEDSVQAVYDVVTVSLPEARAAEPFRLVVAGPQGQGLTNLEETVGGAQLQGGMLRLQWLQ